MDIRGLHNITLIYNNGGGTPSAPTYTAVHLQGVKVDAIDAVMADKFGYDSNDSLRVLIYDDVVQPADGWEVKKNDYIVVGTVDFDGSITNLKRDYTAFKVNSIDHKTSSVKWLHHYEITGG